MTSPTRLLRLLIETGDVSSYEAKQLAIQVGNLLPEGPERTRLMDELQDALDMMEVADIAGVTDPNPERAQALAVLDEIDQTLRKG